MSEAPAAKAAPRVAPAVSAAGGPFFRRKSLGRELGWFLLTLIAVDLIDGTRIRWFEWEVTPRHNINLAEATAWRGGALDLPGPQREAARVAGRLLNPFPPGFTFISYAVLAVVQPLTGVPEFPQWLFRVLIGFPIVAVVYWAVRRCTPAPYCAALIALSFLLGTPMLVMLTLCRIGGFFEVNHVLACCGILLIAADVLGRRRIWPSLIGIVLAFWTRQLTIIYLPAIVWMIVRLPRPLSLRWLVISASVVAVMLSVYGGLNWVKFGSPFDSGYRYIYEGRTDPIAQRARKGLFRPEFIPENLRWMAFEPPGIWMSGGGVVRAMNDNGAGIFLTCPILFAIPLTARRWWSDPARRMLMLLSFGVLLMLLMYHNTGWKQPGYYRFALDFLPVWLVVIAPFLWGRWGFPIVCACSVWSIWYFHFITFNNLLWVGIAG